MNQQNPTANITVKPEFYDAQESREKYLPSAGDEEFNNRTKNRVVNQLDFEAYLLLWHERLKAECERMRKICESAVMVHRRFRGTTLNDQFGYFGTRPETNGRWIDYDPEIDGEVHPINIVRPDIRVNNSALLQVNPSVTVTATSKSAKRAAKAQKIQRMVDSFGRDWTEADRLLIADGIQKEGTWLVETYRQEGSRQKVNTPQIKQTSYAIYQCSACGATGKKEIPAEMAANIPEGAAAPVPCPHCGGEAQGQIRQINEIIKGDGEIQSYKIKHRLWSGLNFHIDRKRAAKGGIKTARYMRIHEIASRSDLEADYPQFKFDHPFEFCYPLKCSAALAENDWSNLSQTYSPAVNSTEFDEFEKDTICLHREAYRNYIAPKDYEFKGADGKVKFSIKRGESLDEAVQRSFGQGTEGFRFVIVNDQLRDIINDKFTEPNFRKSFADVHFLRDSASFNSVPNWDSVQLQDDITLFNTLKTETTARNSVEPVYFNSEVFDIEDFGQDYIPSKEGLLAEEVDINKSVTRVPVAKSADQINEHLNFLMSVRQQVSSVTPALRGESQPGEPAYAQRQQLEQSQGILAPAAKSYAQMYVESMRQKVEAAFNCWTFEQFQEVASLDGEQWSEADVAELVSTDLETEVSFEYVQGTEQPQSNLVKEMNFFNGLRELQPFIQGGVIKPEVMSQIVKKIDEFAGFDFDLSGLETSDALAQSRFEKMQNATRQFEGVTRFRIEKLKGQIIGYSQETDPNTNAPVQVPVTAFDATIEQIWQQADIFVLEFENRASQAIWFVEKMCLEMAKPLPNFFLIETIQYFIQMLQQQAQAETKEAMENDPQMIAAREQEERERADEQQRLLEEKQGQKDAQDAATETLVTQKMLEEGAKEKEREFEREKMAHESAENEKNRQNQKPKGE